MINFPRTKVKSAPVFWNSNKTTRRMQEMRTTTPPREMIDIKARRFRRETWIVQRGWMGRTTIRTSTKMDWGLGLDVIFVKGCF